MNTDRQDLEVVATVTSELVAGAIVGLLERNGIRAVATGTYSTGFRTEAPGQVRVLVKQADCSRAREILDQADQEQEDIDWSNVDVGEPES